jgi:hypothetical protein
MILVKINLAFRFIVSPITCIGFSYRPRSFWLRNSHFLGQSISVFIFLSAQPQTKYPVPSFTAKMNRAVLTKNHIVVK